MELSILFSSLIILLLLYWSAWISSSETALFSLSSHKLKVYLKDSDPTKKLIAELLAHPRDLLVTLFMLNTCVNILLQNVFSDLMGESAGWGLKVGAPLMLTLVFGEVIPKYIGLQNNVSLSYQVAHKVNLLQSALNWFRKVLILITTPISRIMFFFLKKEPSISKEEIELVLKNSEQRGVLKREEAELLTGFLKLQKCQVKELMWPREDILYYDLSQPISKLIHLFVDEETTRIPVCDENLENIRGVLTAMQFFQHQKEIERSTDLLPFCDKPFFAPETSSAKTLLHRMDEEDQVLALLVDEYGSITGLISREDLIELVVGEVEEEKESPPLFIKAGLREVIASGKWELAEFNNYFGAHLKSPNHMITIGGWLSEQVGEIPITGFKTELQEFFFHVLSASPSRINRIFIRKLSSKPPQT